MPVVRNSVLPPEPGAGGHEKRPSESPVREAFFVEMGGVEPPSKQRTKQLSTRLFVLWLSAAACRMTG